MTVMLLWPGFILLVLVLLAFDLGLFSSSTKTISAREALLRTFVYGLLSVFFTGFVYLAYENHWFELGVYANSPAQAADLTGVEIAGSWGHHDHPPSDRDLLPGSGAEAAAMYFSGYLLEQSLSIDNIFVIALILSFFKVAPEHQHRVLLWGILGALLMRGVMIGLGAVIINSFHWVFYLFGAMLVYTAYKMLVSGDEEIDLEQSRIVRVVKRLVPVAPNFDGDRFFTRLDGKLAATPLFIALIIVEFTDLLFAVDSIPAVFGITTDPFLVFTSNVFAILGLRSLYFALADLLDKFRFLKYSLVAVLGFVGVKMLLHDVPAIHDYVKNPIISLAIIVGALGLGIGASFVWPEDKSAPDSENSNE